MPSELFLEIGTEEIPAGFQRPAMKDLERLMRQEFEKARIAFDSIRTFVTPRRLAIAIEGVANEQERQELCLAGPSVKVAFDAEGNPSKAALGFARSNGVEVADLERRVTEKGEYLYLNKVVEGRQTRELLPEILPRIIGSIPFRKSMRWKDLDIRFARPLHWIVALFGGDVVPFEYGNLQSGSLSRGHRFMSPEPFEVKDLRSYLDETRKRFVLADFDERKALVARQVSETATAAGGTLLPDEDLLEEITGLVEDPTPLCGTFEEKYLQLPRELLITTMKEHQRYFSLSDGEGKLMPRFITISNTRIEDPAVVTRGNERVIRARLSDAMFFWGEDQKVKLETRLEALKKVVYQAKLGTSYEKVMRFRELAVILAEKFDPAVRDLTDRAALLAKCDLETGMVYEFPELQGIMGREYAKREGEDPRVALAIYEHYLPVQAGGNLPSDSIGAFVSIADKIDTLCGCFGVGLIPTGTADPYALRRSAIGILNIVLDRGYNLSLKEIVGRSVALLESKLTRPVPEVASDVLEFLRLRFFNMLTAQGQAQDVVDAVLSAGFDDPLDALARVNALCEMKGRDDFETLATAFKRTVNIIKEGVDRPVDAALFANDTEKDLFEAVGTVAKSVEASVAQGDYAEALRAIASLRETVDAFFDGVMVMDKDEAVRNNRLALLTQVAALFRGIADFSRLSA